MADSRIEKLAHLLVHYSLRLKPGDTFALNTFPVAQPLNLAVYEEAVKAGAHVFTQLHIPGAFELFYKYASDDQLAYISPIDRLIIEKFDASLAIGAPSNTRELSNIDPERQRRRRSALAELFQIQMQRSATGDHRWSYTVFPTNAGAQEADMSLSDYEDFVYKAGHLDEDDPVSFWKAEAERQQRLIEWLDGKDQVVLKGSNIDMTFSIKERDFVSAAGHENFPDGEIFTSPVEPTVNGWVSFSYPALYGGREVTNIELWFEEGKIVKEKADKGQELLTTLLNTDEGSRYLGEWGIGTNYNIQQFTKNMLFDEKIGGTIHLAVGAGFPEANSQNHSGLHWDMLCNMADSEITVDGDLFYKDGRIVVEE